MAIISTPAKPYPLSDWLKKPYGAKEGEAFDKYMYKNGESIDSIAKTVSKGGKAITWDQLAAYNWGTGVPAEINYYLKNHNGCKHETSDGKNYYFAEDDTNPYMWVPKVQVEVQKGVYRSPGKQDVGHVALDDESNRHINTLVIKPVYTISIELGDLDALFDPIEETGKQPWQVAGVQQRLQVLGYLYKPLKHPKVTDAAKLCWEHYKKVHTKPGKAAPTDAEAKAILRNETRNNIVSDVAALSHAKGQIHAGRLPLPGKFCMIRFPGGYCYNHDSSYPRPDEPEAKYRRELTGQRHFFEDLVWEENPLLGKIPIVARVERIRQDGTKEPADGVCVYFQLVKPDELKDGNPLKAEKLGTKALDQTKDRRPPANAGKPDDFFLKDGGPQAFYDNRIPAAADPNDPQAKNFPWKINGTIVGGKRDIPVEGTKVGSDFFPGVFEVGTTRVGLHAPRSPKHTQYGRLTAAQKVTPTTETDSEGKTVKKHEHAVRARTNANGIAGVIFTPSRIGGDTYKLRAYVGPETLEFDGTDEKGPVVTTGTMVVWRNVRFQRYLQMKKGARTAAGLSATMQTLLTTNDHGAAYTIDDAWTSAGMDSEIRDGHIVTDEPTWPRAVHHFGTGVARRYRPIDINFINFKKQLNRYYCELICDTDVIPEPMTQQLLFDATNAGIAALKARAGVGAIDWDTLFVLDWTSPFMLNIRSVQEYNSLRGPAFIDITNANYQNVHAAIGQLMIPEMMNYWSGGGVLPGLTLVQVGCSSTWAVNSPAGEWITSGIATHARGAYLNYTYTTQIELAYSYTANTSHELGHVLVRQHAPLTGNATAQADCHQDTNECYCVMSYTGCLGEYCGRCGMALRGARVRNSNAGVVDYTDI